MNLFRIKISITELLFRSRYFYTARINFFFANSYFFSKADSSEKKPFKKSYFFREAAFRKQLLFQKSNITQLAFSEEVLLHSYKLPFHSYTLLWLVTYGDSVWVLSCVTIYSQTSSHNRYLTRYLFAIV